MIAHRPSMFIHKSIISSRAALVQKNCSLFKCCLLARSCPLIQELRPAQKLHLGSNTAPSFRGYTLSNAVPLFRNCTPVQMLRRKHPFRMSAAHTTAPKPSPTADGGSFRAAHRPHSLSGLSPPDRHPRAAGTARQTPPDRNCRSSNSPNPVQQPPDRYVRQLSQHLYRHGHARRTTVSTKHSDLPEQLYKPVPSTASRDRNSAEDAPAPHGSGQQRNAMADGSRPTAPDVRIRVYNLVSTTRPHGPSNAVPNGAPPQVP